MICVEKFNFKIDFEAQILNQQHKDKKKKCSQNIIFVSQKSIFQSSVSISYNKEYEQFTIKIHWLETSLDKTLD